MFVWIKLLHQSNLRKMLKHFGDFAPKQDFKKLFFSHGHFTSTTIFTVAEPSHRFKFRTLIMSLCRSSYCGNDLTLLIPNNG